MGEVLPMLGDSLENFIRNAYLRPVEEIVHMLEQTFDIYHQQVEAYEKEERIHAWNWACGLIDKWDN